MHPPIPSFVRRQFPSWVRGIVTIPLALAALGHGPALGQDMTRPGSPLPAFRNPPPPAVSTDPEESDLVLRAPWSGEELGTGTRRPTPEQWSWGESNLERLQRIPITPIGLERVNNHRAIHGRSPIQTLFFDTDSSPRDLTGAAKSTDTTATGATTGAITGSLPSGIDNSTLKFFPPIRSQGSLNSCAQFSAVYYTLTHMTAMARNWDAKSGGDTYRLSPKWTYNMVNGGANNGSWHYDAYAIAQKHGIATWAEFPYDADYRAWCLTPTTWWNAIRLRADQAGKVTGLNGSTGLNQLKQLLVNGYVLNFATFINSWVWGTVANDPATPADDALAGKPCVKLVSGTSGGHSMTIVGYNDDLWVDHNTNGVVDAGEKGALRIANSWGTGWNEGGFCWVSYKALVTRNPSRTAEGLAWYDEATWVTARASYTPRLVAQFTISHAKRSQFAATLGLSAAELPTPTTVWSPYRVLAGSGGAFAFNGTTTPISGTFYLDFTDLAPMTAGPKRFHLGLRDSLSGDPLTFDSYNLIDNIRGKTITASTSPANIDLTQYYAGVDYDVVAGTLPPEAVLLASATGGNIPLVVDFDASDSVDPDGTISAVHWDFGDGTIGTGFTAQHTYTRAGTFIARVTVTDNEGGQASASVTITTSDPNILLAPSGLTAAASASLVTLAWSDNATNEGGYAIERGVKTRSGAVVYSVVGTTGANATRYSEVVAAGTHVYRVRAFQASTGRSSDYSNTYSIRVR